MNQKLGNRKQKKTAAIVAIGVAIWYFFFNKKDDLKATVEGGVGEFGSPGTNGILDDLVSTDLKTPSYVPSKVRFGTVKTPSFKASVKPETFSYEKTCCNHL
ncbi:hypothetical protein [Flagellimonas sp. CMM7]|uniref:hypothetical protein n=1 Tax=Flagellimonas sp. CMM7 TaxID=2654676 RepID=UPI0013D1E544|nr:hypothetical protein [Flagellimonas sp. CMM7]UII79566.1 hypothetical protein LV704_18135 [Flagellimonas sp. CMM7]